MPTDELLTRYVLERFLYRLSRSEHRDRLVRKGGMLLEAYAIRRPTRDIDLQGRRIHGDPESIGEIGRQVSRITVEDGVTYHGHQLDAEVIREDALYRGVRLRVPSALGRARSTLRLDVSVGEPIVPGPEIISYPTLLDGDAFDIVGYAIETVLAEKIETMIRRGSTNTRDRDFADVWLILRRQTVVGDRITAALTATAAHRGTRLTGLVEALGNLGRDRQRDWSVHLRRSRAEKVPDRLSEVIDDIARFVDPVVEHSVGGRTWHPDLQRWRR